MLDVSSGIAECVLSVVDVNADGTVAGMSLSQHSLPQWSALAPLKLKRSTFKNPNYPPLPRYKATVSAISRAGLD